MIKKDDIESKNIIVSTTEEETSSIKDQTSSSINEGQRIESGAKWINNRGEEVKNVFGFNENAELVNARAAMFGFAMLLLTELIFKGEATTHAIFGIN